MKIYIIQDHLCMQIVMFKTILNRFIVKGDNYENVSNTTSLAKVF